MSSGRSSLDRGLLEPWRNRNVNLLPYAVVPPTSALLLGELAVFHGLASTALALDLLVLLFCLLVPIRFQATVELLGPLALLALFRVVNVGMPAALGPPLPTYAVVYLAVLPAIYLVLRPADARTVVVNPPAARTYALPAIGFGVVLGIGEYTILEPTAPIPTWSTSWVLAGVVVLVGLVALVEEVAFRGILQPALVEEFGRWGGIGLASALFGAMHAAYGSVPEIAFATCFGVLLGTTYEYLDSIELVVATHGVANVFLFLVVPSHGLALGLA